MRHRFSVLSTATVFGIVAALLAACSGISNPIVTGTPTVPATGVPGTGTATIVSGTPPAVTDIVARAMHTAMRDATYHLDVTAGSLTTVISTVTATGTVTKRPARTDLTFSSLTLFGFAAAAEVVLDEATGVYAKVLPANQWVKVDPRIIGQQVGTVDFINYDQIVQPHLLGAETINGIATWHVTGSLQSGVNATPDDPKAEDFWVRQSDEYPVKTFIRPPDVSMVTPTGTPVTDNRRVTETVTFTAWDTGITIALPTGVIGG